MLVELFPITILRKAKLNYTPYTCCLLVVVGNKRYFLESEVCRGHLTRKQHCNLDSERGAWSISRPLVTSWCRRTWHWASVAEASPRWAATWRTTTAATTRTLAGGQDTRIQPRPTVYLYLSTKPQQASAGGRARQTGEVGVSMGRAGGQPPHLHRPPLGLVLGPQQAADHGLGSLQLQLPAAIPCSVSLQ